MFGWLRAEAARASCTKRRAAAVVGEPLGGQDLDRDLAAEPRVAGAVHLAHASGAEGRRGSRTARADSRGKRHRSLERDGGLRLPSQQVAESLFVSGQEQAVLGRVRRRPSIRRCGEVARRGCRHPPPGTAGAPATPSRSRIRSWSASGPHPGSVRPSPEPGPGCRRPAGRERGHGARRGARPQHQSLKPVCSHTRHARSTSSGSRGRSRSIVLSREDRARRAGPEVRAPHTDEHEPHARPREGSATRRVKGSNVSSRSSTRDRSSCARRAVSTTHVLSAPGAASGRPSSRSMARR